MGYTTNSSQLFTIMVPVWTSLLRQSPFGRLARNATRVKERQPMTSQQTFRQHDDTAMSESPCERLPVLTSLDRLPSCTQHVSYRPYGIRGALSWRYHFAAVDVL